MMPRDEVVRMYQQVQQAKLDNELLTSDSYSSLSSDPEFAPGKQAQFIMLQLVESLYMYSIVCLKACSKHYMFLTTLLFVVV